MHTIQVGYIHLVAAVQFVCNTGHRLLLFAGPILVCFPQQRCIDYTGFPTVIWPKSSRNADGYCYCLAHSSNFPNCASRCASIYQLMLDGSRICLVSRSNGILVPRNEVLKVYFVDDGDPCSGYSCFISSIRNLYQITQPGKLHLLWMLWIQILPFSHGIQRPIQRGCALLYLRNLSYKWRLNDCIVELAILQGDKY